MDYQLNDGDFFPPEIGGLESPELLKLPRKF